MIDVLDGQLLELLMAEPRVGVLEASRRLGVARGTVQARLDRMHARGVITGYGPDIDPAALDYGVMAFITLEIRQAGGHDPVAEQAFREIARLTGGAWSRFDPGAAAQLRELLRAAAAYAAGGREALLLMSRNDSGAARLLGQMK